MGLLTASTHRFKNRNENYLGLNFKAQASPKASLICIHFASIRLNQKCSFLLSTLPSLCQRYSEGP